MSGTNVDTITLTGEDVGDASNALLCWIEDQDIGLKDAVRVLTLSLVAVIHEISIKDGLDAKAGGRVIGKIIVESLP